MLQQITKKQAEKSLAKALFPAKPFISVKHGQFGWRFAVRVRRNRYCSDLAIGSSLAEVVGLAIAETVK